MNQAERNILRRQKWIDTYLSCGSVSQTARKYGIARSTLQRWLKRFTINGKNGLFEKSKRPLKLASQKTNDEIENLVLLIRQEFRYGKIRICSQLLREYNVKLSAPRLAEFCIKMR